MNRFFALTLVLTLGVPSCVIYDRALLDEIDHSENPGVGGISPGVGGTASGGSTGGAVGAGGAEPGVGGNGETGGMGGSGAEASTGGMDPGSGGDTGSGGEPGCDPTTGKKGAFSVPVTQVIDDFGTQWSMIGEGSPFDGQWNTPNDMQGSDLLPEPPTGSTWFYEQDPCFQAGDTSLHITGTGYTTWGASFDANLLKTGLGYNASASLGVVFWARSSVGNQIKIGFSDESTSSAIEVGPRLLNNTWKEYKIPFPGGLEPAKLKVVHLVVVAGDDFDLWFDDLSLYE